ncbi:thymidine kinase (plasmid) [Rossellomorea sp. AcN35-11]|nr:thymidine kinase [Rossellomorea aquimaris]WJV32244.1 thymidine kinase [Rossellomorea sp. AcN35-11]
MAKLYFKYGTMAAGKSARLIDVASSYERQGKEVLIITTDDSGVVSSRNGAERDAVTVKDDTDIKNLVLSGDYKIILVDEAQFLSPSKIEELHHIALDEQIPVMAFGLKDDFRKEVFPGAIKLFALAESVEEIRAICADCEKKATCNMRHIDGVPIVKGDQVLRSKNSYKAVCSHCYRRAIKSALLV